MDSFVGGNFPSFANLGLYECFIDHFSILMLLNVMGPAIT